MSPYRVIVNENDRGGPEKLRIQAFTIKQPKPNHIIIKVNACGVNYIDTYHRSGLYPNVTRIGLEGSGIIIALGSNAKKKYKIGDKVCWDSTPGSYATHLITSVKNKNITKIPPSLFDDSSDELSVYKHAASVLSQGLTAHYLSRSVYKVSSTDTVLIHAGAGGCGGLLIQICKRICNAKCVICTVGSEEKKKIAFENGADHVILYKREDFYERVMDITKGKGCDVVFDGVGKMTAMESLKCCAVRGMMVYFGNASGAVPAIDPLLLMRQGSVIMTRPTLKDFCRTEEERQMRVDEIFEWNAQNKVMDFYTLDYVY